MKAGVFIYPQNRADLERFVAYESSGDHSLSQGNPDRDLWEEELRFGELVEPLGFDQIWTVEHHFSPYAMITNTLQYLTYWAARTEHIGLGTMVVVLPWHHPLRVAEDITMLQYMLGDRDLTVGFGRGAARREYGGFNISQSESRPRFDEAVKLVKTALTEERFSFNGEFYTVPDVSQRPESPHLSLRPRPRDGQRLVDNFHGAWGSPQSAPILGALGLKPLVIPQRGFIEYEKELAVANEARVSAGYQPASPTVAVWSVCAPTAAKAQEIAEYGNMGNFALGDVNYEFSQGYHGDVPGYEHYAEMFKRARAATEAGTSGDATPYGDMPQGTPDECIQKIQAIIELLHPQQMLFDFKFGGISFADAQQSMQLFAKEVLPFVHELPEPSLPGVEVTAPG